MTEGSRWESRKFFVLLFLMGLAAAPAVGQEYQLGATVPGPRSIDGVAWFPLGPAPLIGELSTYGQPPFSGRARVVAANPANPDEVFLGTAAGGVWHSLDAGLTWRPITSGAPSLAVGALRLEDCESDGCGRIWVGTGENALRRDTYYGGGLLLLSPAEFGLFSQVVLGGERFAKGSINNIVLRGDDGSGLATQVWITVSRGTSSNATQSTVNAPPPAAGYGIHVLDFAGTIPALGTWTKQTIPGTETGLEREGQAPGDGALPTDLEIDPGNEDVLYAGFLGTGVFVTQDGGGKWCPLTPSLAGDPTCPVVPVGADDTLPAPDGTPVPFDHIELALAPGDSNRLYALLGFCSDRVGDPGRPDLYVHLDVASGRNTGTGFEKVYAGTGASIAITSLCRYTHSLVVDPRDSDLVYVGAQLLYRIDQSARTPGVLATPNQIAPEIHADHHAFEFVPDGGGYRVYSASDGGFYATSSPVGSDPQAIDFTNTNFAPRNDDLVTALVQSIGASFAPGNDFVVIGTQDNGCYAFNGTRRWPRLGSLQDCGSTFVDSADPSLVYNIEIRDGVERRRGLTEDEFIGVGVTGEAAFYAPLIQDPNAAPGTGSHPLYVGTNQVFRSTNAETDSASFSAVSPLFDPSLDIFPGTARKNMITALAAAPGIPGRIYAGLYDGKIWASDPGAFPCGSDFSCWDLIGDPTVAGSPLPAAPVTSFGISRGNPGTVWATYSGFTSRNRVFRRVGGGAWEPRSSGLPNVPVNVIAIEERPGGAEVLWLGSDRGVQRSDDAGASWTSSTPIDGLPNVPVYDIAIDQRDGSARLYAATHGRGVYVISAPFLTVLEGWVDGDIWDIPVHGSGFPVEGDLCDVSVLLEDGTSCASGGEDEFGTIQVVGGNLTTDNPVTLEGDDRLVVLACFNNACVGGVDIDTCNADPTNRIASIEVVCDSGVIARAPIGFECPVQANPPSTLFGVSGLPAGIAAAAEALVQPALALPDQGIVPEAGVFDVIATVQAGDGTSRTLCAVPVPYEASDTPAEVAMRAGAAIDASSECQEAGVSARLVGFDPLDLTQEDDFDDDPGMGLRAPGVLGGQLVASLRVPPGEATGLCYQLRGLGVPQLRQVLIPQIRLDTAPTGAAGGEIRITERSTLGECAVEIATAPGETAEELAARFAAAFQDPLLDSDACPTAANPRDITQSDNRLFTVLPSELEICSGDAGVGFFFAPEELEPVIASLSVEIDIKPRNRANVINPKSFGVTAVALLGSESFDVTEVDSQSLAFGPGGAPRVGRRRLKDVNRDGFRDLLGFYRTHQAAIPFDATEACLTGETRAGVPFEGCDAVRIVPKKNVGPGTTGRGARRAASRGAARRQR